MRYSDSLWAGRSGDRYRWGTIFLVHAPIGPGAHPASCIMGTVFLSSGRSGRGVASTTQPHLQPRLKKEYNSSVMRMVLARHHPHRTYDLRGCSQDHHPSTNSVQKTIRCNSTSNAPDDGLMRPKHVELRIHQ